MERNPTKRASIPSLLNHPFIKQYRDVNLVEEFHPLIEEAIEQNSQDREMSKETPILQFLKEDAINRQEDESDFSDEVMTPMSYIQYNDVSNFSSPHSPFPIPSFPSTGIPLVALNVYEQMKKQKEAEAQEKGMNFLLEEELDLMSDEEEDAQPMTESLTESLGESSPVVHTLHLPEGLSSDESIDIQDSILIPPDNIDSSTCLSPICPLSLETIHLEHYLKQVEEDTWEGVATPTYHSCHESNGGDNYSLCNIADSIRSGDDVASFVDSFSDFHTESPSKPVPRFHLSFSKCNDNLPIAAAIEGTLEEDDDHVVKTGWLSPPHLLPVTKPLPIMIPDTDTCHEEPTLDEEFPQLFSIPTSISFSEIEDPVFMCPKITSEKKLSDRMTRRPLSWRQRFIRAWNRCVRWCFGVRKRNDSSRQSHHRRCGCCGRKR